MLKIEEPEAEEFPEIEAKDLPIGSYGIVTDKDWLRYKDALVYRVTNKDLAGILRTGTLDTWDLCNKMDLRVRLLPPGTKITFTIG